VPPLAPNPGDATGIKYKILTKVVRFQSIS